MATYPLAEPRFYGLVGLTSVPVGEREEDAGETFKIGELLTINPATGEVSVAGADPTFVEGVSMRAASGVEGTKIPFIRNIPGVQWEMSLENSTTPNHVAVETNIGAFYGVAVSANRWYVDVAETTTRVVKVIKLMQGYNLGDIRARVIVEFTLASME